MSDGAAAPRARTSDSGRWAVWAAMAVGLVALSLLVRAASFVDAPLDRDEGAYALIAQQWQRGARLYLDYFDHKPPLIYAVYRASFAIAGEHLAAVRTLFALANACTALACAIAVWQLTGRRAFLPSWLAGSAACVFLNSPVVQGEIANTEALMVLGTAAGACFLLRATQSGRARDALLVGLCSGLAVLAKPVALIEAAFFAGWLVIHTTRRGSLLALFLIGLLLPGAAAALYAVTQGTLAASIAAVVLYNLQYAGTAVVPLWARLAVIPIDYGVPLALLWAGVAGCMLSVLRTEAQPANFALGWTVAALIGTLASGRIYDHYYQQLIPPMAVAVGVTAGAIDRLTHGRFVRGLYAVAIALGFWPPLAASWRFAAHSGGRTCADWQPRLAAVVRQLTEPGDRLLVWGAEPYLYFAADRQPLSRFIYKYPLLGGSSAAVAARHQLLAAADERPPALIVVVKGAATAEPGQSPAKEILAPDAPFHPLLAGLVPGLETSDFVLYTRPDATSLPWAARWEQTTPAGCS
jgi:4-amino-4-deoxy-L-arabinose transferase-like glycosyltransferase